MLTTCFLVILVVIRIIYIAHYGIVSRQIFVIYKTVYRNINNIPTIFTYNTDISFSIF